VLLVELSQDEFIEKRSENDDLIVIDVRSKSEFAQGRLPGSINIPHEDILQNISLLDVYKENDIVFYCLSGVRADRVTNYLANSRFHFSKVLFQLEGDLHGWNAANQPIEK